MGPEALEILFSLAAALGAGMLVGAQREQVGHAAFGGVRTFPLIALSGAIGMLLGWPVLLVVGAAFGVLLAIAYYRESARDEALGLSSEAAAVVTFALGALCTARDLPLGLRDRLLVVAALATVTLALLAVKRPLHRLIDQVTEDDVLATTRLLVLAAVVLPLLPDQAMGPWGALNPRSIGLLAVLINAIGLAGYAAIRIFGPHRGVVLTGLFGGLVSSTAVTLVFARRARESPVLTRVCALAIVLASATLFGRVVIEVAAVSPRLAAAAIWPFLAAGVVSLLGAAVLYVRLRAGSAEQRTNGTEPAFGNPFSIWAALKFSLLFVVILLLSHGAAHYFSDLGVYVSAAVAGLADVDAISLSIARMYEADRIGRFTALTALVIASTSNTLIKIVLCALLGSRALVARVAVRLLAGLAAGAVLLLLLGI